jgi:flagellar hook-basal body complex protein FliE
MTAMVMASSIGGVGGLSIPTTQLATPTAATPQQSGSDFASMLGKLAGETADTLRQGEAAALSSITGSLPLQTLVDRVMVAERTLQTAIAVRDKVVSAYLEVSRMQI